MIAGQRQQGALVSWRRHRQDGRGARRNHCIELHDSREHAQIGQIKSRPAKVFRQRAVMPDFLLERTPILGKPGKRAAGNVTHHRSEQSVFGFHGDPHVHPLAAREAIGGPGRIEIGLLLHGQRAGPGEQQRERRIVRVRIRLDG